jgi:hypothetical protein
MNSSDNPKPEQRDDFGTCEFCGEPGTELVAVLEADEDQRVCGVCHDDPRVPTRARKKHTTRNVKAIEALNVIPPERLRNLANFMEVFIPAVADYLKSRGVGGRPDDAVQSDLRKMADLSEEALRLEAVHES